LAIINMRIAATSVPDDAPEIEHKEVLFWTNPRVPGPGKLEQGG